MREYDWLLQDKYDGQKTEEYFKDIGRLESGEPIDYVIGWKPFLSCHIDLSYRPLIPRPETEYWTERVIEHIQRHPEPAVLDLCAGSGCIGTAVLSHVPHARVDFGEVDTHLLKQIQYNLSINDIPQQRYSLLSSDLFADITDTYDFILANPPYIDTDSDTVAHSVREWEPHGALFARQNGLALIERLLTHANTYMNENALLCIECDENQVSYITKLAYRNNFTRVDVWKDQYGKNRVIVVEN